MSERNPHLGGQWQPVAGQPAWAPYQQPPQPNPHPSHPPPADVPVFEVTAMTHIGALVFWYNQRRVVQGTYAQCDAALRAAQVQNLLLGWWSFLSILILNWVALLHNWKARKHLSQDVQQVQAYAQWWHAIIGPGRR